MGMLRLKVTSKTSLAVLAGVAVLTVVLSLVVANWVMSPPAGPSPGQSAREFTAALTRWETRPFSHYRLISQSSSNNPAVGRQCQRDLEIQAENVVTVFQNTCPGWADGMTVTDIFYLFGSYIPQTAGSSSPPTLRPGLPTPTPYLPSSSTLGEWVPASDGCHYYLVVAVFDDGLGYPHDIETQLKLPNTNGTFSCLTIDSPQYKVTILSLTPIQ